MKIYIPNISKQSIGGGWTFLRNFKKAIPQSSEFVDSWKEADVVFVVGVTMVDMNDLREAHKNNVPIVFRVDNVPRKSRNKRNTPYERMKEIADMSEIVVYQSEWAKSYCEPICGEGTVIYNGVDTDIFYPPEKRPYYNDRYLFAYHGKNEMKAFWKAHMYFQIISRGNPEAEFWFINDFGRETDALKEANFDFWNGEKYKHLSQAETPEQMAEIMRKCTHLLFPSIGDAAPNTVLEARACGLKIRCIEENINLTGTSEMIELEDYTLERMGDEYLAIMHLVTQF